LEWIQKLNKLREKTVFNVEGFLFNEEQIYRLRKLTKELDSYRGRHTELVSVYIPAGYQVSDIINQLVNEKSTASNIKSKTTRKNVLTALEKIIQHLRLLKHTPENGFVVFSGNISEVEGKEDIRIWSFEPPIKMNQKMYWCDQKFVIEPLKEIVQEKEVYGLLVLDAKEAYMGLLKGKTLQVVKHEDSTVPSKSVKGGMCVSEESLLELEDGNIIPIKELQRGNQILSYSFKDFRPLFNDSFEMFKRKANKSYELIFEEPSNSLILTPEHLVFVVDKNGIVERSVDEIKVGDLLLSISKVQTKNVDNKNMSKGLTQLLGYVLGDGTIDNNRIILYDKDSQLLNVYKEIAAKIIKKKPVISKRRNSYELRLYKKSFVDFILSNFPKLSQPRRAKDIDDTILKLPKEKLKCFVRGLFDAEGYVDQKSGLGLRMTNENIVRKVQLILTRFNVVASMRGPDKFDRYELRITNPIYVKNFSTHIGFSSEAKSEKLKLKIKKYTMGMSTRVPISGILVRRLIEKEGLKKEDFKKYSMFLSGKRNIGYPIFRKIIQECKRKLKNKETINILEKIYNSDLITVTVKEKRRIKTNKEFYDLYVPGSNSFVVNGIVVHNSQRRYDRIREDALNEFFRKVAELASQVFLQEQDLKGVIIGGPGPIKEQFYKGNYLHYEIQNKVLGVKDISYTDESGLEELVHRSEDLMKEAAIVKEREILTAFFTELQKEGKITYGLKETEKALEMGAVETLLVSEDFDWIRGKFICQNGHEFEKDVKKDSEVKCSKCLTPAKLDQFEDLNEYLIERAKTLGTKVEIISTQTVEGRQFKELGGIAAFLRYKI
jgi:peptide subunit release factor 1 (eRF1)/intein/homing endonuclease